MSEPQRWIFQLMKPGDYERITDAVHSAEKLTSAEIVPMIVRRSAPIGHVPWLAFLILLLAFWVLLPFIYELAPYGQAWMWEVGALLLSAFLAWLLSRSDAVARILTSAEDETLSVDRRALLEFHLSRIPSTREGTGVLIFVSQLEHRAVVLADRRIAEKFPPETWQETVDELISNIKKGDFTGGMCSAIESLGNRLAREFPWREGDHNELSDRLVVKE